MPQSYHDNHLVRCIEPLNDTGPVTLIARIVAEPVRRDTYIPLRVRAASITLQKAWENEATARIG